MRLKRLVLSIALNLIAVSALFGQAAPPPRTYAGSFGGGIALTGGNTDTQNFNLTFNLVRDPKTKNVIKSTAAYLRGNQNDINTLDRTAFNARDEYTISGRTF